MGDPLFTETTPSAPDFGSYPRRSGVDKWMLCIRSCKTSHGSGAGY